MRRLLADYTNIEADRITFEYGKNRKPFLSEKFSREKIRFNLSHSNGYALFAFTCEREIGVDLEHICEFADMYQIAEQVFSTNEMAILRSFPEAEKNEVFYKFWTRKEAYIKAIGEGFSAALDTIDISSHPTNSAVFVDERGNSKDKKHWFVQDLRPVPAFAAAFAVEGGKVRHRCWQIPKFLFEFRRENGKIRGHPIIFCQGLI
jgi:4'-phosphopantetheinyl transferase